MPIFASKLWSLFELCELEGNQRAGSDPEWAALLARIRIGQQTDADIQTLQRMAFKKNDKRKPAKGAVHLFATRQQVTRRNNEYIEDFAERMHLQIYESPAADMSLSSGVPLPPEKAWLQSEDTGGLEMLLRLAIGAEVMLRKNLDVPDGLVNGARGIVQHIDLHPGGEIDKVWVSFEKGAGSRWQMAHQTLSVAIRRAMAQFNDKDGNKAERRQFPLVLAKACTIHKSQSATYHAGVHARLDKHCKQAGQTYVALSRSPTQKLCTLECFDSSCLHFNANAQWALVTLKEKLARNSGPSKPALQDLWQAVIRPADSATHYQMQLAHMERPNWKQYREEQRANEAPKEDEEGGALTCPRCGWIAKDNAAYKKHKCPAKQRGPKAKAKGKVKAQSKQAPKPKATPKATGGKGSTAEENPSEAPAPATKAPKHGVDPPAPPSPPPLPPPADPPPPDLEPPAPCFYFEKQQAGRCGMHALNHALGCAAFTPQDMRTAAASYLQELQGIDDAAHEHIRPGGWYSVQILYTALFNRGYTLNFHQPIQSKQEAHLAPALVQNWSNQHWVAYRWGHDGAIYLLDSMRDGPHRMLEEEFNATLAMHWTYVVEPTANP